MKKTYVWTDWVPERHRERITLNKCYEVTPWLANTGVIINNSGIEWVIRYAGCAHLDGRAWNVVHRDIFEPKRKRHPDSDRAWTRGNMSGNSSLARGNLYRLAECEEVPEHLRKRYRALAVEAGKLRSELMDWFKFNPVNSNRPDFSPEYIDLVKRINEIDPDAACYLVEVAPFEEDWDDFRTLGGIMIWGATPQGNLYWRTLSHILEEQK